MKLPVFCATCILLAAFAGGAAFGQSHTASASTSPAASFSSAPAPSAPSNPTSTPPSSAPSNPSAAPVSSTPAASSSAPAIQRSGSTPTASPLVLEAGSDSRYQQATALSQVEKLIGKNPGKLSAAERSTAYAVLSAIALSGTARPIVTGNTVINSFPLLRMHACRDIGKLRGVRAEKILLSVLRNDSAPVVLAEAVYQLGRVNQGSKRGVSVAIAEALRTNIERESEGLFAYSALQTLDRLAKSGKLAPTASLYSEVLLLGKLGYGYRVDNAESATLQTLISKG